MIFVVDLLPSSDCLAFSEVKIGVRQQVTATLRRLQCPSDLHKLRILLPDGHISMIFRLHLTWNGVVDCKRVGRCKQQFA
jgi:hypothetical protein